MKINNTAVFGSIQIITIITITKKIVVFDNE